MLNESSQKGRFSPKPLLAGVEVIIVITNMVLCPGGLSDEVDLWNCIQKPSIRPIFAWRGLTLTPAAAAHIHELVAKNPDILGVR